MIEFENVSKSFWTGKQRKVILDRASFRVELGNSLGILAPNGTGKTTIINMMAGLEKPDEGRVTRTSRISFPLGFMGGVVSKHTGTENVRYIARLYSLDPDYVESFCRWLCGIDEYFDMPVGTYSSGMRSRFAFAHHARAGIRHLPDRRGHARRRRMWSSTAGRAASCGTGSRTRPSSSSRTRRKPLRNFAAPRPC